MVELLLNKFKVKAEVKKDNGKARGKNCYHIAINSKGCADFISLVYPYIIPCMQYKTGSIEWKRKKGIE